MGVADAGLPGRRLGGAELRRRLRRRLRPADLRLRAHVVDPAALLAEPRPAVPVRRLRAVPAPVPARPAAARGRSTSRPIVRSTSRRSSASSCSSERIDRRRRPRTTCTGRGGTMAYTPVEIRHVKLKRGLLGYGRKHVDRLLDEIADSFETVWRERADHADKVEQLETDLVRYRELETLLRTTLVSAERAAHELKDQAKREADTIVAEAQAEARTITRTGPQRARDALGRGPAPQAAPARRARRARRGGRTTRGRAGRPTTRARRGAAPADEGRLEPEAGLYFWAHGGTRRHASASGSRPAPAAPRSSAATATPGRSASPRRPSTAARTTPSSACSPSASASRGRPSRSSRATPRATRSSSCAGSGSPRPSAGSREAR